MTLSSSFHIGRSALTASQIALHVTGNNMANAATPGYSRQLASIAPARGYRFGNTFLGRGVAVQDVQRQVDLALQSRLRSGVSNHSAATVDLQLLSQLESTLNELTDSDLSSELSRFFNTWSELANAPTQEGTRSLVIQQGANLASFLRTLRRDVGDMRPQIDQQIAANVSRADFLLHEIAAVNRELVAAEAGTATSNSLRDQRDALLEELSELMDISAVEQSSGAVDVLVGSTPVVLAGKYRGIELQRTEAGDRIDVSVALRTDGQRLNISSGRIGALLDQRDALVNDTISTIDTIASQLIFQVNRVHSQGYGAKGLTQITSELPMPGGDAARALNDPGNATMANLPFAPRTGGFFITVTNEATGTTQTVRINVDLDGINDDDTSLADIAAAIDGVDSLSASITPDGRLTMSAASGHTFAFSEDSSGVLAAVGINTFFTGRSAGDIGVRSQLEQSPDLLNVGMLTAGEPNDNLAALTIADLGSKPNEALGGRSISGAWLDTVQGIAMRANGAATRADATQIVRENLETQRAAVSGVSLDEEAVNLITYQRQYQGAARFIAAVDEMTQTLISLV